MKNKQVAEILNEIADILELEDVQFKPRAYRRAALGVESLPEDIAMVAKKGKLENIPGIGKSIAETITEFCKTGKVKYLEKLRKKTPIKVGELSHIEGVGPKTIKKLYQKFKVKNVKELQKIAKEGKIAKLKGFGETIEENILRGIKISKKSKGRMILGFAWPIAEGIIKELKKSRDVKRVDVAGSLRRKKETVGDIDILVASPAPKKVIELFTKLKPVTRVLVKGSTKASVKMESDVQVDIRVIPENIYGAALQYFTGNKIHNIKTRQIAIKKGYKLSEYGLFKGKKIIAAKTEEEIYKKLGLQYIPPEIRRDQSELETAAKNNIPQFIRVKDLQGDLHMHTTASDGGNSIEEMAKAAKQLGRKYIAITDHSGYLKIAGGMTGPQLLKHKEKIKKINKKIPGITILAGTEVDIDKDGKPAIADKYLKELDLVIASIHSGFRGTKKHMTDRLLTAIHNDHVDIIGHPTGRLIKRREPYDFDIDKVFKAAKDTKTCLEIDAYPERLDLRDSLVREAIEKGCKLTIGTDAHSTEHLDFLKFGVFTARRGWAQKKHVLNTQPLNKVLDWFK